MKIPLSYSHDEAIEELNQMSRSLIFASDYPLSIGCLLCDAYIACQLPSFETDAKIPVKKTENCFVHSLLRGHTSCYKLSPSSYENSIS
jgi:hypothetical protein